MTAPLPQSQIAALLTGLALTLSACTASPPVVTSNLASSSTPLAHPKPVPTEDAVADLRLEQSAFDRECQPVLKEHAGIANIVDGLSTDPRHAQGAQSVKASVASINAYRAQSLDARRPAAARLAALVEANNQCRALGHALAVSRTPEAPDGRPASNPVRETAPTRRLSP